MATGLNEELNDMAEKLLRKEEKSKVQKSKMRIGPIEVLCILTMISTVASIAIPAIHRHYREADKISVVSGADYNYKHWANVLVLIHPQYAKRSAEIIAEA